MNIDQTVRSPGENRIELFATIGTIVLFPLFVLLLLAMHIPSELAQVIATATAPLVLIAIRLILVRYGSSDRELREAATGAPIINPFLVCAVVAISILFIESFFGSILGAIAGKALAFGSPGIALNSDEFFRIVITSMSSYVTFLMFVFTIPIAIVASHYFQKRVALWMISAAILSRILRDIIAVTLVPNVVNFGLGALIIGFLEGSATLIIAVLIGSFIGRRRQSAFLLQRAFLKLNSDDREAALQLLIAQKNVTSEK